MSWFLAAIYDRFMSGMERATGDAWRHALVHDLDGEILEIGAGTGKNLDHYRAPARLVLAEPDPHMRKRLEARIATAPPPYPASVVPWPAERLDVGTASFDTVVCTLVLCSVADPDAVLAEVKRVLRPGGRLVFIEHVASERPSRRKWQHRLEPLWKPLADGCHLTRETRKTLEHHGFAFESIQRESVQKALPIFREMIRGVARAPSES